MRQQIRICLLLESIFKSTMNIVATEMVCHCQGITLLMFILFYLRFHDPPSNEISNLLMDI